MSGFHLCLQLSVASNTKMHYSIRKSRKSSPKMPPTRVKKKHRTFLRPALSQKHRKSLSFTQTTPKINTLCCTLPMLIYALLNDILRLAPYWGQPLVFRFIVLTGAHGGETVVGVGFQTNNLDQVLTRPSAT